jgi:hypothetical protein
VHLLAHALAHRGVHQLVALDAALAGKGGRYDERLEVLAVAEYLDALAGEACADAAFDALGRHHVQVLSL